MPGTWYTILTATIRPVLPLTLISHEAYNPGRGGKNTQDNTPPGMFFCRACSLEHKRMAHKMIMACFLPWSRLTVTAHHTQRVVEPRVYLVEEAAPTKATKGEFFPRVPVTKGAAQSNHAGRRSERREGRAASVGARAPRPGVRSPAGHSGR